MEPLTIRGFCKKTFQGMNSLQQQDARYLAHHEHLIGVDEAGRGALAGPVVAAACAVGRALFADPEALVACSLINDSKKLRAADREDSLKLMERLQTSGLIEFAVGVGSVQEILELNILGATRLAMRRAVEKTAALVSGLNLPQFAAEGPLFNETFPAKIIVDGPPLKPFCYAHEGIVKGDSRSLCIAMASIAAKVTRDREMVRLAALHPVYGFDEHKGYGTKAHRQSLLRHGPCDAHRDLFLRKILV